MVALSRAADVLGDPAKRSRYDEDGGEGTDAADFSDDIKTSMEYWRSVFRQVTEEDIVSFEQTYRGSKDEEQDVLKAYTSAKGDMNRLRVVTHVLSSIRSRHVFCSS
jgi:DnaJ family protein C protein 9